MLLALILVIYWMITFIPQVRLHCVRFLCFSGLNAVKMN